MKKIFPILGTALLLNGAVNGQQSDITTGNRLKPEFYQTFGANLPEGQSDSAYYILQDPAIVDADEIGLDVKVAESDLFDRDDIEQDNTRISYQDLLGAVEFAKTLTNEDIEALQDVFELDTKEKQVVQVVLAGPSGDERERRSDLKALFEKYPKLGRFVALLLGGGIIFGLFIPALNDKLQKPLINIGHKIGGDAATILGGFALAYLTYFLYKEPLDLTKKNLFAFQALLAFWIVTPYFNNVNIWIKLFGSAAAAYIFGSYIDSVYNFIDKNTNEDHFIWYVLSIWGLTALNIGNKKEQIKLALAIALAGFFGTYFNTEVFDVKRKDNAPARVEKTGDWIDKKTDDLFSNDGENEELETRVDKDGVTWTKVDGIWVRPTTEKEKELDRLRQDKARQMEEDRQRQIKSVPSHSLDGH